MQRHCLTVILMLKLPNYLQPACVSRCHCDELREPLSQNLPEKKETKIHSEYMFGILLPSGALVYVVGLIETINY
jgi:hypothetical protein